MIGTIDDILKKKYDEVKVPERLLNLDFVFKKIEKKEKSFKIITATILIVVIMLTGLIGHLNFKLKEATNNIHTINIERTNR